MTAKELYFKAHREYSEIKLPNVIKDGHYCNPKYPKIETSNGLTNYVVNIINWLGGNATRISSAGRMVDTKQKQASGTVLTIKKYIPSTTRKGSSDITSTIKGRSVKFEIKIGNDKASSYQLEEQQREIKAGGYYFFIKTPDDFWQCYNKVLSEIK